MKNNHLVIMAGGAGSRFWPLSSEERPKQFLDVLGCGRTLLQLTASRFEGLVPPENVWVVTSAAYHDLVREQLPDLAEDHILLEPCRRNTAPCIAYVSWKIKKLNPRANVVVAPSDHVVTDLDLFHAAVGECMEFAAETDAIVTLGIRPDRPETGYGYIEADLSHSSLRMKNIFRVDSFREKPSLDVAEGYIKEPNYFWNSGIFFWSVTTIVNAFRVYCPEMARFFESLLPVYGTPDEQAAIDDGFPACENISSTTPSWRRLRKSSSTLPSSDGATWAPGAPSARRASRTCTAMPASASTSTSTRRTTASSTPRRRSALSFRDWTATSWWRRMTSC